MSQYSEDHKDDPTFQKLTQLRDVEGYKGWVDQDGNKIPDVDKWIGEQKKASGWTS